MAKKGNVTTTKTKRKTRAAYAVPPGRALVLRANAADMTSHGGMFTWPRSGHVEAPDWKPRAECGHGLHGWLWGAGDINASGGAHESADAVWLVVDGETIKAGVAYVVRVENGVARFVEKSKA